MEIVAKANDDGTYDLLLYNAPPKTTVEVRWQNTLSGATFIDTIETSNDGEAKLAHVQGFGQHCVPTVRILDNLNAIKLVSFTYSVNESDDLRLIQVEEQPTATAVPVIQHEAELEEDDHV